MAKQRNLIADAIADARELKATAIAGAKLQLEEAFSPTLQRIVSTRIQEEDEEEMDDVEVDVTTDDESDEDFGFDSFTGDDTEDELDEETDTDLELESLLRELDGEEEDMMDEECDDDMTEEDDWEDDTMMDEEWDEDEMTEEEDMDYGQDELEEAIRAYVESESCGDDLDMGLNDEDGGVYTESRRRRFQKQNDSKLKMKVNSLQTQLSEALRANATYKRALNEVNLLNAKLLYNQKVTRQYNLTEAQREKIIDSFDRATTIREVKLVYTTICESQNKKMKLSESVSTASKRISQINPKSEKVVGWSYDRLQRLAGLKNDQE